MVFLIAAILRALFIGPFVGPLRKGHEDNYGARLADRWDEQLPAPPPLIPGAPELISNRKKRVKFTIQHYLC